MPQSSHRLSWMGAHTHCIQAGRPSGSNPDGHCQLACRAIQERGETPFELNQYNHQVGLDAEKCVSTSDLPLRSIGMNTIPTCLLNRCWIVSRSWVPRRHSLTSGGTTISRRQARLLVVPSIGSTLSCTLELCLSEG